MAQTSGYDARPSAHVFLEVRHAQAQQTLETRGLHLSAAMGEQSHFARCRRQLVPRIAGMETLVMPLVAEHMSGAASSDAGKFRCGGIARIDDDGTIDIQFVRDGNRVAHIRCAPSSDLYSEATELVGTSERGTEKEVSCWPARP
jgi:hypothetical protein